MMSTLEANLDMSSTFLESPEITTWSLLAGLSRHNSNLLDDTSCWLMDCVVVVKPNA